MALLVERLQDERAAVALNIFLNRTSGQESIGELQKFSRNDMNITRFNIMTVSTDKNEVSLNMRWMINKNIRRVILFKFLLFVSVLPTN